MKTLKKVLCLVLALAMVLGMTVVSSAATTAENSLTYTDPFTDADSITDKEAVEVLNALGVFVGTDGKADAQGSLTRAAAAKFVCYLMLGKDTAEALPVANIFSDVDASNWANKYISYLYGQGIVAGVGDGKFAPNDGVTGYAFGKMLLVALGYDATAEALTGSTWAVNTAKLMANQKVVKLDKNAAGKGNVVLTREEAARYVLNALREYKAEYSSGVSVATGNTTVTVNKTKTVAENDKNTLMYDRYTEDLKRVDSNADSFGRTGTRWTYKGMTIGTYADKADYTFTGKVTKAQMYTLFDGSQYTGFKVILNNETVFDLTTAGAVNPDGAYKASKAAIIQKDNTGSMKDNDGDDLTGNGTTTQIYLNDKTNVATIVVVDTLIAKVTKAYKASSDEVTLQIKTVDGMTTNVVKGKDVPSLVGAAKDEYYVVTASKDTDGTKYTIKSAVKATTVEGKVSSVSGTTVTVDGTAYEKNVALTSSAIKGTVKANSKVKLIVDANNYVGYVDEATVSVDEYLFITYAGNKSSLNDADIIATAYFTDGTSKTITVDGDSTAKPTVADDHSERGVENYKWYTYTVTSEGKYQLTVAAGTTPQAVNTVLNNENVKLVKNGTVEISSNGAVQAAANADTVYIVRTTDDKTTKAYTGYKAVPTVTSGSAYILMKTDNSYAKVVYIETTTANVDDAQTTDVTYVLKKGDEVSDLVNGKSTTVYKMEVLQNGEVKTVLAKGDTATGAVKTLAKSYNTNSDGYVTKFNAVTTSTSINNYKDVFVSGTALSNSGNVLCLKSSDGSLVKYFTLDSNSTVVVVNYSETRSNTDKTYELATGLDASGVVAEFDSSVVASGTKLNVWAKVDTDSHLVTYLYITVDDYTVE